MDFNRACEILNITPPFDLKRLKQNYHKAALKHHPDKNFGENSSPIFQDIGEAYTFLSIWLDADSTAPPTFDYSSILDNFIRVVGEKNSLDKCEINSLFDNLIYGCRTLSLNALKQTDKETAVKLFGYVVRYSELLGLDEVTISLMREIVKEKMSNDELVIINPSIDNLLNDDVYCLTHNDDVFYIPLWHDEISFDLSGSMLVVKCIPDIGEHIHVNEQNVLQVNVSTQCSKVFEDGGINVKLGSKKYIIPGHEILIQPFQTYTMRSVGIAQINTSAIYNANNKSDIVFNITLTK
jgi:hypothetical protein